MLRIACLLMLLLLIGLQYRLWRGEGGRADVEALAGTVQRQEAENAQLQQRNDDLVAEVEDLKTGTAAVEERARTELGMIKPGETFYRIVDKQTAARSPQP